MKNKENQNGYAADYANATEACNLAGKKIAHYVSNKETAVFLKVLSESTGTPIPVLVQSRAGSPCSGGGTWVHPQVFEHLSLWLKKDRRVFKHGHVYIVSNNNGLVKIGKATNPLDRLATLSMHGGFYLIDYWISAPIKDYTELEQSLHTGLHKLRALGEWFRVPYKDAVALAANHPLSPFGFKQCHSNRM